MLEIKPVFHLHTGKLLLKGRFLFSIENWVEQLFIDFKPGFPSHVYCHFTIEKQRSTPVKLTGNAYLAMRKVSVTCTYAYEKEEQPGGFTGRIFKE